MGCISSVSKSSVGNQSKLSQSAISASPNSQTANALQRLSDDPPKSTKKTSPLGPSDANNTTDLKNKVPSTPVKVAFNANVSSNEKENALIDPDLQDVKVAAHATESNRASSRRKSRFFVEDPVDFSALAQESKKEEPFLDSHGSLEPEQPKTINPIDPRKYDSLTNFAGAESANSKKIEMKQLYGKIDMSERKNQVGI